MTKEPAFYSQKFERTLPKEYLEYGYVWPSPNQSGKEIDSLLLSDVASQKKDEGPACECGAVPAKYDSKCFRHRDKTIKRVTCQGLKKSGEPCTNKALFGKTLCGVHAKSK